MFVNLASDSWNCCIMLLIAPDLTDFDRNLAAKIIPFVVVLLPTHPAIMIVIKAAKALLTSPKMEVKVKEKKFKVTDKEGNDRGTEVTRSVHFSVSFSHISFFPSDDDGGIDEAVGDAIKDREKNELHLAAGEGAGAGAGAGEIKDVSLRNGKKTGADSAEGAIRDIVSLRNGVDREKELHLDAGKNTSTVGAESAIKDEYSLGKTKEEDDSPLYREETFREERTTSIRCERAKNI